MIQDTLGAAVLIAVMLAAFGVLLYLVDKYMPSVRGMDSIGVRTGLFLGSRRRWRCSPASRAPGSR